MYDQMIDFAINRNKVAPYTLKMYASNKIHNVAGKPPAICAFERLKVTEYQPIKGKLEIGKPIK